MLLDDGHKFETDGLKNLVNKIKFKLLDKSKLTNLLSFAAIVKYNLNLNRLKCV